MPRYKLANLLRFSFGAGLAGIERMRTLALLWSGEDYSGARGGTLVAYRWDGEQELIRNKYCFI